MTENAIALAIVSVIGVLALVFLFATSITGEASTRVCPANTAPIISGERFLGEFEKFQDLGYQCFLGYDGITPCCARGGKEVKQYEHLIERQPFEARAGWIYKTR